MPFQQFYHFLKVVETKSVNKAAIQLDMSQQALRMSILSLEKKIGFQLFIRKKQGVELTLNGQNILPDIQTIISLSEQWKDKNIWDETMKSEVHIASTTSSFNTILPNFAYECKQNWPNLNLILHEKRYREIFSFVVENEIIGLLGALLDKDENDLFKLVESKEMTLEKVSRDDYQIIINAQHPLAQNAKIYLKDLQNFMIAMYPNDEDTFPYKEIYSFFSSKTPYIYLEKQYHILNLVAKERNVAAVFPISSVMFSEIFSKNLKIYSIEDFSMPASMYLLYCNKDKLNPAARHVLEFLRKTIHNIYGNLS